MLKACCYSVIFEVDLVLIQLVVTIHTTVGEEIVDVMYKGRR